MMSLNNNNVTRHNEAVRRDELDLDSRYRKIGISAVAAALQFRCEAPKKRAYAPISHPWRKRGPELNLE
jgi:hypothetical protein